MRTKLTSALLLLGASVVLLAAPKEDKMIVSISIPMDKKGDAQTGHVVLKYSLYESGLAVNVREVYDWAHQAMHEKELSAEDLEKAKGIVRRLPVRADRVAKDRSVVVEEILPDGNKERIYDRTKLPAAMKDLFSLLGGIRFEVKDELKFDPEPGNQADHQ